jgi:hypothetical protein
MWPEPTAWGATRSNLVGPLPPRTDPYVQRYPLLGPHLAAQEAAKADRLMSRRPGEEKFMGTFAWVRALERWLAGDLDGATAALERARKGNPFAEKYVSGSVPFRRKRRSISCQVTRRNPKCTAGNSQSHGNAIPRFLSGCERTEAEVPLGHDGAPAFATGLRTVILPGLGLQGPYPLACEGLRRAAGTFLHLLIL